MRIKFCFKPGGFIMLDDVKEVGFTSHTASEAVYNTVSQSMNEKFADCLMYIHPDYLSSENGCTPKGESDNEFWVNECFVLRNNGDDSKGYCFTGTAYLLDENNKTIDVMR